jgi:hypothetical protein
MARRGKMDKSATACECKTFCWANWKGVTHFRRRLSWTVHLTLSHLQFPQGNCSTTSHRTLRARQDAHARGARRLVTLLALSLESAVEPVRFLAWPSTANETFFAVFAVVSVPPGVELSACPSPGVETDSEREWKSASLAAIVSSWWFCRRME